jgi:hypothetical protein
MRNSNSQTSIYLVAYHSERDQYRRDCKGQFLAVEQAISAETWPYDNGDDPSFYVERNGGRLTWGVCRQELRTALRTASIVAFFSFTTEPKTARILYRLSAIATVAERLDHRSVYRDPRLKSKCYINTMIRPLEDGWKYDENDRPIEARHADWLWRMVDHKHIKKEDFEERNASIIRSGSFVEEDVSSGNIKFANNYILFSDQLNDTYISPDPPLVAFSLKNTHESALDDELYRLTVDTAKKINGRGYLRVVNKSGRNVHRHIHFKMQSGEAISWREQLIAKLKERAPKVAPAGG